MENWTKIKIVVKSAHAASLTEPKILAPIIPMIEESLKILEKSPTTQSLDQLKYFLGKSQDFVKRWRPSPERKPGVIYSQPIWAKSTDEQIGEAISLISNYQIEDHDQLTPTVIKSTMKIFISHSSANTKVAESLVELLRASLNIKSKEIRCSSVEGYKLPAGADSNEQLRMEVFESDVFIALLSPASLKSTYVLFELGARWGVRKYMAPILIDGASPDDLESPLSEIHAINGTSDADLHQLIEAIAKRIGLEHESPSVYQKKLDTFKNKAEESW